MTENKSSDNENQSEEETSNDERSTKEEEETREFVIDLESGSDDIEVISKESSDIEESDSNTENDLTSDEDSSSETDTVEQGEEVAEISQEEESENPVVSPGYSGELTEETTTGAEVIRGGNFEIEEAETFPIDPNFGKDDDSITDSTGNLLDERILKEPPPQVNKFQSLRDLLEQPPIQSDCPPNMNLEECKKLSDITNNKLLPNNPLK